VVKFHRLLKNKSRHVIDRLYSISNLCIKLINKSIHLFRQRVGRRTCATYMHLRAALPERAREGERDFVHVARQAMEIEGEGDMGYI
jgi:hypothetical protein